MFLKGPYIFKKRVTIYGTAKIFHEIRYASVGRPTQITKKVSHFIVSQVTFENLWKMFL